MSLQEDPTIKLCSIGNSFLKEKRERPTVEFFSLKDENKLEVNIVFNEGYTVSEPDDYDDLVEKGDFASTIELKTKNLVNPFHEIGNSVFSSRESVIMANIDTVYQLTNSLVNMQNPQTDLNFRFCDLAGNPGHFSKYLKWRLPNSIGYGLQLKGQDDWTLYPDSFKPFYGLDDKGDIFDSWKDFEKFVKQDNSDGVELVMATGKIKSDRRIDEETFNIKLITIECYLAVSLVMHIGKFVCKIFDTCTDYMRHLIYIMANAFSEISIIKPMSSDPFSSDRFLVCVGRKKEVDEYKTLLLSLINNDKIIDTILDNVPEYFLQWLDDNNNLNAKNQLRHLTNLTDILSSKEIEKVKYNNHKALMCWILPGNKDESSYEKQRIRDPLLNINYNRPDLYKYDSVEEFIESGNNNDFPFKSYYYEDSMLILMFNKLKKYDWRDDIKFVTKNKYSIATINMSSEQLKFKGIQEVIFNRPQEYLLYNILSDTFFSIEEQRLKTSVMKRETPWEYYWNNLEEIAGDALREKGKITPHTLRETLYKKSKEATSFRPNLVVTMSKMFGAKSMLDFSAGWGDRLIGALASGMSYVGVDPNKNLMKGYMEIIDFFTEKNNLNPDNYKIINLPIEDADLSEIENVDLVMTSPPYFDLEIYSDDKSQSTTRYKGENLWFSKFLAVAIDKTIEKLNDGGHLVIVINQKSPKEGYIKKMLDHTNKKLNYLGVISYGKQGNNYSIEKPQPMWIWRKGEAKIMLVEITFNMNYELSRIVKNKDNMKHIAQGKEWDTNKLKKFISYQKNKDNNYYWRGIQIDGRLEGLIGIHSVKYADGHFVTRVLNVDYRRKGIGTTALRQAIAEFSELNTSAEKIFSDTLINNIAAQKSLEKVGFVKIGKVKIRGSAGEYYRYSYTIER